MPSPIRPTWAPTRRVRSEAKPGPAATRPTAQSAEPHLPVEKTFDDIHSARRRQLHQREHDGQEQRGDEPKHDARERPLLGRAVGVEPDRATIYCGGLGDGAT